MTPRDSVKVITSIADAGVGEARRDSVSAADLDQHIADCGRRMEAAYQRFGCTGKGADRAEAGRWRVAMQQAVEARERLAR
jgi:hypothetical protein